VDKKAVPLDSLCHTIQRIIFYLIFFKKYVIIIIEKIKMGKYQKMAFSPGRTLHPAKALKQKFF
jgi:hypothetical protein